MKRFAHLHGPILTVLVVLTVGIMLLMSPAMAAPLKTLPKFRLKLIDGGSVDSRDLEGKITVIDFWGTWCKPCLVEIPEYNRFYGDFKERNVRFIALATDSGSVDEVKSAARRLKIEYPVAVPTWDEIDLFGSIEAFPTTLVFDAKGILVKSFVGTSSGKQEVLRQTVERLLSSR